MKWNHFQFFFGIKIRCENFTKICIHYDICTWINLSSCLVQRHGDARRLRRRLLHRHKNFLLPRRLTWTWQCYEFRYMIPGHQNRQALAFVFIWIHVRGLRLGGGIVVICLEIRIAGDRSTEGSDFLPVVAAGEDTTQAEYDDQEECRSEREPDGRTRCVHPGRCIRRILHHLYCN